MPGNKNPAMDYMQKLKNIDIGIVKNNRWLKSAVTKGLMIAAQDQSLPTRNYLTNIIKNGLIPICRSCEQKTESIDHLISSRPILTPIEYKERHDKITHCIHLKVCK